MPVGLVINSVELATDGVYTDAFYVVLASSVGAKFVTNNGKLIALATVNSVEIVNALDSYFGGPSWRSSQWESETFILSATDITNGYITLTGTPSDAEQLLVQNETLR